MKRQTISDTGTVFPDGVIIVDKPADMSSAAVVRRIKRLAGVSKVGHAGTLDPFATGVLVCPINKGTRLSQFFLHGRKKYAATLRLGTTTDTQDHTGTVVTEKPSGNLSEKTINRVFSQFVGDIKQFPPVYSALKHNGVPLYRHARNGHFIQKPARTVHISHIDIREIRLPDIVFEVQCAGGTYIRTLCADIGEILGCGGHLRKLDRTESSGFGREEAVSLERLEQADQLEDLVIPMADALKTMPACTADERLAEKIRHGRGLAADDFSDCEKALPSASYVKITAPDNRLLAVIHVAENKIDYKYCCVFHYH
ncbi:MAG: tRNA pseudouridine(55) synthase TruB [Desulfosalsimonadaceae bacterium]